jgi:UDP-glucuronate decarboxylase
MKILITGGAGFIGSNLCKYLLKQNNTIFCMDNLYTGNYENIKPLTSNNYFTFIYHDIRCKPFPKINNVDQIYHLACPASPPQYQRDPIYTLDTATIGTKNVFDFGLTINANILYASTSEIYGNPIEHPQKETYFGNVNSFGPRSIYDEGKRYGETLAYEYNKKYGLFIKIARIFNTYGQYMNINDGRVISNFIVQALKGKKLTIYGDGSQTRSFCYIDDLIEGFIKLIDAPCNTPMNLGNPQEYSILDCIKIIEKLLDKKLNTEFLKLPKDDPKKRRPNIFFAKKALGWEPKISFNDGLIKTIEYFKEIL